MDSNPFGTLFTIMPNPDHDTFITWLRDAYAFEKKLVTELKAHAGEAADHPEIQTKIQQHIGQTERHAQIVQGILESLGSDISTIKTLVGQAAGAAMGMSTSLVGDTMVKNALAEFTMEHTEIASYVSLIAAAQHLGLTQHVEPLRQILRDEEAMADWLRNQIPVVTIHHLEHEMVGAH
jgi:ferritin-like metal-binding protein YciE